MNRMRKGKGEDTVTFKNRDASVKRQHNTLQAACQTLCTRSWPSHKPESATELREWFWIPRSASESACG